MISSAATPATGLPRNPRGTSPQASVVCRPIDSRRFQISGTSSMPTQWNWMFWRSVMSAVSRANSVAMPPSTVARGVDGVAVGAHPHHEVPVAQLGVVELGRAPTVDARAPLGVEPPPAEPAAQIVGRDGVEPFLGVDLLDALTHTEAAFVLLPLLVAVERRGPVDLPLPVRTVGTRRSRGWTRSGRRLGYRHVIECITPDYSLPNRVHDLSTTDRGRMSEVLRAGRTRRRARAPGRGSGAGCRGPWSPSRPAGAARGPRRPGLVSGRRRPRSPARRPP